MKAQIDGAHVMMDGERRWWLQMRLLPEYDFPAKQLCGDMQSGEVYDVEVRKSKKRRSLDANAYFWVLLDKLSARLKTPKLELYRQIIPDVGGNSQTVCVPTPGAERLRRTWEAHGLGWVTDSFESKIPGCTNVVLYYGSSTYDAAQMGRLIDLAVAECRAQGVDTATPSELARLKEDWGKNK